MNNTLAQNCVVIDGDHNQKILLVEALKSIPDVKLIGTFSSGFEALRQVPHLGIELLFIDTQTDDLNGIQILKSLSYRPNIILTSIHTHYAFDAYEHDVIDYLHKPYTFERLLKAIHKTSKYWPIEGSVHADHPLSNQSASHYLNIKSQHELFRINYDNISYIEAMGNYVKIHTLDGKFYTSIERLSNLEMSLPNTQFARIHRSYLIAIGRVTWVGKDDLKIGEKVLPLGNTYKRNFVQNLKNSTF